jgi:hypothetical protein
LEFDLEPGWVPDDPWDVRWEFGATALEFRGSDALWLTLPEGTAVKLRLPLPEVVTLPAPKSSELR